MDQQVAQCTGVRGGGGGGGGAMRKGGGSKSQKVGQIFYERGANNLRK